MIRRSALILALLVSCNGVKDSKAPSGDGTIDVYEMAQLSVTEMEPIQSYAYESGFKGADYSFVYQNRSFRTVNGVRTVDIPIASPITANLSNLIASPLVVGKSGRPLCNLITEIPAGGECEFMVRVDFNTPVGDHLDSPMASWNVISTISGQTFTNSVTLGRFYNKTSNKKLVTWMVEEPWDYNSLQEAGMTKGMAIGVIDLATKSAIYAGPCETLSDGTTGNPRGVYPFLDQQGNSSVRAINNSVLFTGRGCSWSGSSLEFERPGLWKYRIDLPKGPTNPRRISRDATTPSAAYYEQSAPNSAMVVLNNKLYYIATSNLGSVLDAGNIDRKALFEYDPSQPLSGTNPKEILTGYDATTAATGLSSQPIMITTNSNKVYFTGIYHTKSPTQSFAGVIEYDPSLPISTNDVSVIELSDNPRLIWGYNQNDYYNHEFGFDHQRAFLVNEEFIAINATLPQNTSSPAHTPDPDGKSLYFIRLSDYQITKHDFCDGPCDSDVIQIAKTSDKVTFVTKYTRPDSSVDRSFGYITIDRDVLLNPIFSNVTIADTNTAGLDITHDTWDFSQIAHPNGKRYFPSQVTNGMNSLFEFNPSTGGITQLFTGNFRGDSSDSFKQLKLDSEGRITFRHISPAEEPSFGVYDPSQPQSGTSPQDMNANWKAKLVNDVWDSAEDSNFYYVSVGYLCPDESEAWYIETITKETDRVALGSSGEYPSACAAPYKYSVSNIIMVK